MQYVQGVKSSATAEPVKQVGGSVDQTGLFFTGCSSGGNMKKTNLSVIAAAAVLAAGSMAHAGLDGVLDAGTGPALATQLNGTGFGDNNLANGATANGSELNAAYGKIDVANHKLYLMLTGNLETNFNKLDVFIQAKAGGPSTIAAGAPTQGGFNNFIGTKFDAGFNPTSWFSVTAGGAANNIYVDYVDIVGNAGQYLGTTNIGASDTLTGGSGIPSFRVGINNSNVAGVTGAGANAAAVLAVTTGVELTFDLNELGWNGVDAINIAAMINGSGNDYLSNQILGSLPLGSGNLGGPGSVDFSGIAGNQFFTIAVPEPVSAAPLALLGTALLGRRRK
jgi:hypothetical protein